MKSNLNIKSILIIAIIGILSFVFFGKSFAADTAKVSVDTANIRQSADVNSTIIEQANLGEEVQIIEKTGDWYKVKYNNVEGYLRADLLNVNGTIATENTASENTSTENQETTNKSVNNTENATKETVQPTATEAVKTVEDKTGMYTCKQSTTLKIIPLINGINIKNINQDETVNVLEVNNKWAYVESGVNRGWVLISKIEKVNGEQPAQATEEPETEQQPETTIEATMYVNSEVVNLREEPNTSSQSLARLNIGTEVIVHSNNDGWSKVTVDGKDGYISSSLLTDRKPEETTSRALVEERQDANVEEQEEISAPVANYSSATGNAVCDYARQFEGCSYVYGGTTPDGFDCSGFTQYVFSNFGIGLNRTAEAQASNGTYVSKDELQAGDLLIFNHHAGIYLGDGTFIHAENSRTGVVITDLDSSYYTNNYITARRVVE
ncbi:MAG: SH3 domain-containing protein [Clostridia bacterium]|nr:SH3 domain-containing protein [Clostridia bacterium]